MSRRSKADECKAVDLKYEFCFAHRNVRNTIVHTSSNYKHLVDNILSHCEPYDGEKVFVVFQDGTYKLICPVWKIKLARRWYSISVANNGFMYVHLLQNFVPNTRDCVYNGSHITIGPHMRSKEDYLHFHITNINVTIRDEHIVGNKTNHAICSTSYKNLEAVFSNREHQKQRFQELTCLQDNMSLRDIIWDGVRHDQLDDTVSMLLSLFKKGMSPHSSS